MLKSNFEFEVLVNGHSAKEYYHKGSYYIEGREGTRFSLRMKNNSGHRVLFVPTIDGLSIMDGKEGSFDSRGYIVNAYDATTIDGWRTSDKEVAEFFFSSPKGSYAKKINKGNNLGVIGCAVFKEMEIPLRYFATSGGTTTFNIPMGGPITPREGTPEPVWTMTTSLPYNPSGTHYDSMLSTSGSGGSVNCAYTSSAQGLGTGFGQDKDSPVITVSFNKELSPSEIFSMFYNTRANLESIGVEFKKPVYVTPSAFPKEEGYCKRPD